jgi:hypothetical protein
MTRTAEKLFGSCCFNPALVLIRLRGRAVARAMNLSDRLATRLGRVDVMYNHGLVLLVARFKSVADGTTVMR